MGVDGAIRGLPLLRPQGGGGGNWPAGWEYPDVEVVHSGATAGSNPSYSLADVQDGDIMVAFGATRNGTITGPSGGGWTTLYKVDQSTNEWHAVYAKVASGEGASFNFTMSTYASSGYGVFRCANLDIDAWAHAHYGYWSARTPIVVAKPGVNLSIIMGSAFGAVGNDSNVDDLTNFAYVHSSDEFVKGWWENCTHDGHFGYHYMIGNDSRYMSYHSINLYAA
jgi:hypothetical protein